jgi:Zn-dependent protease with chaperone function
MTACMWLALLIVFTTLGAITLLGDVQGNTVRVHEKQFPELFEILQNQSKILGLKNTPQMYIMHNGGFLNAFATKLFRRNYIVLYSEVLEAAYQEGMPVVEFIIGHELGHIKRKHVGGLKSLFITPAKLMPLLGNAYFRACEYTCDHIGYNLCPEGAQKGLLILATGKNLYKKIQVDELLADFDGNKGLVTWIAEIFATHPPLIKRIAKLRKPKYAYNMQTILTPTLENI